jgi:hypothetical protein
MVLKKIKCSMCGKLVYEDLCADRKDGSLCSLGIYYESNNNKKT